MHKINAPHFLYPYGVEWVSNSVCSEQNSNWRQVSAILLFYSFPSTFLPSCLCSCTMCEFTSTLIYTSISNFYSHEQQKFGSQADLKRLHKQSEFQGTQSLHDMLCYQRLHTDSTNRTSLAQKRL